MDTQTLSPGALSAIDLYIYFRIGQAACSIPYFNNKTVRARGSLDVWIGKGSPKEIVDEVNALIFKNHIDTKAIGPDSLKKLLVDKGIGIDCSGFAYHVLNAESKERQKGELKKHLTFTRASGLMRGFVSKLRPANNTDVSTLVDDRNSHIVALNDVRPGDMITMIQEQGDDERNHILIVHAVDKPRDGSIVIRYSHAIAYPTDGLYGSGVKQGSIEVIDQNAPILKQLWKEGGTTEGAAEIFARAEHSRTELRRLNWL